MLRLKRGFIFIGLFCCLLLSGTSFGYATIIYNETFDAGQNLAQLGFTGSIPSGWEMSSAGYMQSVVLNQRQFQKASIDTPSFRANREGGTITIQWQASFFTKKQVRDWDKNNSLKVSLADANGKRLYSLSFLPNFLRLPLNVNISPLILNKADRILPLQLTYTKTEIPTEKWLQFKMELDSPTQKGGDGRIKVSCDFGGGFREYLNVADSTFTRFAKLNFLTELGNGRHQNRVGIDNILVTGANRDNTAPVTTSDYRNDGVWVNAPITIHLISTDQESGVAHTYYKINNGADTIGNNIAINDDGIYSVEYWAVDNAGNAEQHHSLTVKMDSVSPTTTNDYQSDGVWVNGPINVNLTAKDDASGVANTYYLINNGAVQTGTALSFTIDGIYTVQYWSIDNAGNKETTHTFTMKLDQTGPVLTPVVSPTPNANGWNNSAVTIAFTADDNLSGVATVTDPITVSSEGIAQIFSGEAADKAGNKAVVAVTVNLDKTPPVISNIQPKGGSYTNNPEPEITADLIDTVSGIDSASVKLSIDGNVITSGVAISAGGISYTPGNNLADGSHTITLTANDKAGNQAVSVSSTFIIDATLPNLPPDPAAVAPKLDNTAVPDMCSATKFLYSGDNPIQTGVAPDTIHPVRAAVIRGKVLNKDNQGLPGVKIAVLGHPEFGQTVSREDGAFDLAVNGGGLLTVCYERMGYLSVQRQVDTPWQDYAFLPDVVFLKEDSQVTPITVNNQDGQIARGSMSSDNSGQRQATLFFPPGTQVSGLNGNVVHVRATEFTVGANGPKAMPAPLPPTSGYTYCIDLSIDEAGSVQFNQPIYSYVKNFLNFPVGGVVPAGYYDESKGVWVPSQNGRIIQIVGIVNGYAEIDVSGNGEPADAQTLAVLGFTDAERQKLASIYSVGQSLWRVPVTHFSAWDYNWPYGPPPGATAPKQPLAKKYQKIDNPTSCGGSIIEMQNQVLGETVNIAGTPFTLNYSSDRVPGRTAANRLTIPLSGETIPANLKRIDLQIFVAGREFSQSFPAAPQQKYVFNWDGKDGYGRIIQGSQSVRIRIGYVYNAVYYQTQSSLDESFGQFGNGTPISGWLDPSKEVTIWQEESQSIGSIVFSSDSQCWGLGGWSLSVHHYYDSKGRVLYLGDGSRRSAEIINKVIVTAVGNGEWGFNGDDIAAGKSKLCVPSEVAAAADGSLYIADTGNRRIRRVSPDGIITTVAGTGEDGYSGDDGPAIAAKIGPPMCVAVGPDGSVYFGGQDNRIRKIRIDGTITTVAGTGESGFSGDGGPGTAARIFDPYGLAIGTDGCIYISDHGNNRIRKVDVNGIINTIAERATLNESGYSHGLEVTIYPSKISIDLNGNIYFVDGKLDIIWRLGPNGSITQFAGRSDGWNQNDGIPVMEFRFVDIDKIVPAPDGSFYISSAYPARIYRIGPDGIIITIAGSEGNDTYYSGNPATGTSLSWPTGLTVSPDGIVYFADWTMGSIYKLFQPLPGFATQEIAIPSEDGSELYKFDTNGRHLATLDVLTGKVKYSFEYDQSSLLIKITDIDGNVTTVERDINGNPTAIVGTFGQRTILGVEADGYLNSVINPAHETVRMTYGSSGLLINYTDPKNGTHDFTYDNLGRLIKDQDPVGGYTALKYTETDNGYIITATKTKDNQSSYITTYSTENLPDGRMRLINKGCCGGATETIINTDGSQVVTMPDGTVTTTQKGPDPCFGMLAPVVKSTMVTTPGGLKYSMTNSRTAALSDPDNQLSVTQLTDTVTVNGKIATTVYDATTRTITRTSPMGWQVVSTLDDKGRVIHVQAPGVASVSFHYDSYGRLDTVTEGTGSTARVSAISYNSQGYIDNTIDPMGHVTRFTQYDAVGRVLQETLPDGKVINFSYDANGNVTTLTPPGKPSHGFNYNSVNLVDTYTAPDTGTGISNLTDYNYNLNKQLTSLTRPDGITINYDYDTNGRLFDIRLPGGGTLTYVYDANKNFLHNIIAPDNGTLSFTYDGSLPTSTTWDGTVKGSVGVSYNSDFLVTSQSVNGGNSISLSYNDDGQLTGIGALTLNYDTTNGMFTGSSIGNVTDTVANRNEFGEVTDYRVKYNGSDIFGTQYTYDKLGRIDTKTETIDGQTHTYRYGYDPLGQLTDVWKDGIFISHYDYDNNGNRIGGSYDAQDRMAQYGNNTYQYNANGELKQKVTSNGTTNYVYDQLGNLTSVTLSDGTKIDYVIDGANRRIGKKVNGVMVQGWLYLGATKPIAELDGNNNVIARFVYGTSSFLPDYMIKNGVTYRIVNDYLNNPRMVVDISTGQVVQRMDFDEFGNVISDTNPGFTPFGYAGGLYDNDTKLVRFGFRDYDTETGRWTAKDPVGFDGDDTNLYCYVGNDPINGADPAGLFSTNDLKDFGAGVLDELSFGVSGWVLAQLGVDVNKCSGWYKAGGWAGFGISIASGAGAGAKLAGKGFAKLLFKDAALEFSHWVPERSLPRIIKGLGRTALNGNNVSIEYHAMSDIYRRKFMSRAWKATQNILPEGLQQLMRIPWVYPGATAGAGYGAASMNHNNSGCDCN